MDNKIKAFIKKLEVTNNNVSNDGVVLIRNDFLQNMNLERKTFSSKNRCQMLEKKNIGKRFQRKLFWISADPFVLAVVPGTPTTDF